MDELMYKVTVMKSMGINKEVIKNFINKQRCSNITKYKLYNFLEV